jgi:hypothetical protein
VFRLAPARSDGMTAPVTVDPPVDRFLRRHFRQYGQFFGASLGGDDGPRRYPRLAEDPQLDDITILAVRRIAPAIPEPERVPRAGEEEPVEVLPLTDDEGL